MWRTAHFILYHKKYVSISIKLTLILIYVCMHKVSFCFFSTINAAHKICKLPEVQQSMQEIESDSS